jgi:hypothetical protein
MTGLLDIPSRVPASVLPVVLAAIGMAVGTLTGLLGIGGAIIITPLLNVMLGIPYTLVAGSSLGFVLGTSSGGMARHMRLGNVAPKLMLILAIPAAVGTVLGGEIHLGLRRACGEVGFTMVMHGLFIAVLLVVAALVWRGPVQRKGQRSILQRIPLPPRVSIPSADLHGLSLPGLCAVGLAGGMLAGLLGVGGGILLVPAFILLVGMSVHQSVGTSLGVVLFCSLSGVLYYGLRGESSLWLVLPLLVGSTVGVQLGSYFCQKLHAAKLQRLFAVVVLLVAAYLLVDFVAMIRKT